MEGPSNPLPGYIGSLIRYGMGMLGPLLMSHHILSSQGDVDLITGAIITVGGVVWIIIHNNRVAHTINAAAASAPSGTRTGGINAPNVPL